MSYRTLIPLGIDTSLKTDYSTYYYYYYIIIIIILEWKITTMSTCKDLSLRIEKQGRFLDKVLINA